MDGKHQAGNPKEKTPFCAPGTELRVKVKMLTAVVIDDLGAHALRKKAEHSFLEFSLCMSRACLG
eukprot:COSAG06_NODE_258_length_18940_cov_15.039648_4_plen_65_part_00